jgi:hypothetical protein
MSEHTVRCTFSFLGCPEQSGTMTFRDGSEFAEFASDDGKTKTVVHRRVLSQGNVTWDK